MIKKSEKLPLSLLYYFSLLILGIYVITLLSGGFIFVYKFIGIIFNIESINSFAQQTGIGGSSHPVWGIVTALLLYFLLIFQTIFVYFITKLLNKLRTNKTFIESNLKNIKWIMYSFGWIALLDGIGALLRNIVPYGFSALPDAGGLQIEIIAWFAFYVIYIVFKHGVQLQDDANRII
ncbi:MAG: hypothetical protein LKF37_09345 [Lentilactobacillus diolivorans]|jgi:hypothetical protein|uniref:DUF2975 domain-containing protein n=1 Tax=Lentilactobacillus hilgardii TaxID=1588 RepID=A0A6P1E8R3_LENHI|nr:hypothetical protein [Lentilactobacillus hilgardii]MCH4164962.1 hypothetical protein [Lentilactobacillus diolivorans]RRG11299.1 MAG: hypothetical protein DUD35_07395 [Lactobacillus sp.]EEI72620.1 hypothetical protein HMPREF0496_0142 [Lentilactobacillus hilgardii ATCC 27305]MCT3391282.1 hypothetical protein [Lentilactobacillus hilgardii]QHB53178.1 hypothetical protein GQR93_13770 [Lentilactobacillus hilgardii]